MLDSRQSNLEPTLNSNTNTQANQRSFSLVMIIRSPGIQKGVFKQGTFGKAM